MAKFSPHYNPHKVTSLVRSFIDWIFWIVFILSCLPVISREFSNSELCMTLLNIINIVSILLFFTLEIIVEYILFPQSEQKRRDDFLDNSFGSKFSSVNSVEYYSNENVSIGLYKAACNLFENSFFTYSLIKALTIRKIILPAFVLLFVWVLAYFGFNKVPLGLSILQVLFSANVLGNLIKHLILFNKLSIIHEKWIALFQIHDFKQFPLHHQSQIFHIWILYETILSRMQPSIPDNFFQKHNPNLSLEWKSMKNKYSII